ncbi:MAG TPA: response regulator [Bryobacteraceae bacterium]|nr:response regulator [Bryobacteraceae bacterium]HOQ46896.1 response regulator [Bryobacteraceae bacterium]HPQ14354.1 response regulator [Bryobacteraceae bacterium]HPU73021.1 response regulator [Bryobacteraceae bacterium]
MGYRVLIVDDSPAMRSVIRRVIVLSGFDLEECLEAEHGGEACRLLQERPVDVILTDINMPVMNGERFLEAIKADQSLEAIPVVVVSTDATEHRIRRMLELGAQGYVTKPFFPESLRGELERVLGVNYG